MRKKSLILYLVIPANVISGATYEVEEDLQKIKKRVKTLFYFFVVSKISLAAISPVAAAVTMFPALPAPSPTIYTS